MKYLFLAIGFLIASAGSGFAADRSVLARVTVYWHNGKSGQCACWNGVRLHTGHCAVDPKKIPYGSKVMFPDIACLAVDSGPDVINRKAARRCARNASQRNAVVIDRFFETKKEALAWEKAHPYFMTIQVVTADSHKVVKQSRIADSAPPAESHFPPLNSPASLHPQQLGVLVRAACDFVSDFPAS
jgi:3D (Asp-Asp-Asp) domain-containing protein